MGLEKELTFELNTAREAAASFAAACGVGCAVFDPKGAVLFERRPEEGDCAVCRAIARKNGENLHCEKVHLYGTYQAERFGGRYIYFCPSGLAYFASPIMVGGRVAGSLVGGPVLIMDVEDYLAGEPHMRSAVTGEDLDALRAALEHSPYIEPSRLSHMSELLFATAAYVGDSIASLFASREETVQQQDIGSHIQQLKPEGAPPAYPLAKERELVHAITEGDQPAARRLLNEILGHILFSTGGDFPLMRARALELMVVLSRAAVDGGGDIDQIFNLNYRYLNEIDRLRTAEDLILWLTRVMERFADLVFNLVDIKHKDVIYRAIDYLKRSYRGKITLEDTALYVGLSPSYFSKIFKDEMGTTFNNYLSLLRINKSKAVLLSSGASIAEVCDRCGFDDQSYFTKVFKKYTGVTPGRFRERRGRLEPQKERGNLD